jgi:hypothetical protein
MCDGSGAAEAVGVITSENKAEVGVTGEMEATDVGPALDAAQSAVEVTRDE